MTSSFQPDRALRRPFRQSERRVVSRAHDTTGRRGPSSVRLARPLQGHHPDAAGGRRCGAGPASDASTVQHQPVEITPRLGLVWYSATRDSANADRQHAARRPATRTLSHARIASCRNIVKYSGPPRRKTWADLLRAGLARQGSALGGPWRRERGQVRSCSTRAGPSRPRALRTAPRSKSHAQGRPAMAPTPASMTSQDSR